MPAPPVVVVTGASAGVGRATAEAFARRGASVALLARGESRLETAARAIEALGGRPLALACDVARESEVEDAATTVEAELGPIDVWVNNAMATVFARFLDVRPEEFRLAVEVTYLGAVWGTRAALLRMVPRDRGIVVQVGSALAYRGIPLQSAYCGAKHALRGFTDSVRTELMHDGSGVRLTMVQLPALNTPQFSWGRARVPNHPQPVPPIFQPEVAAGAVVWAAEHAPRELLVGWPTVKTVVGNKLLPSLADRKLARDGIASQQLSEPLDRDRPDNLEQPAPGGWGAHGRFDESAHERSVLLSLRTHAREIALAAAGVAAAGLCVRVLGRRS
jgi:NAD(P)-dependent dehydrogenase (short-subunit alcohol dehydrogenase family)